MISVCFQGKLFSITVSKYMPQALMLKKLKLNSATKTYKTNTKKKKKCLFYQRGLECKSRKSREPGVTGKFGLGVQNGKG